jgi:hypothetical protein
VITLTHARLRARGRDRVLLHRVLSGLAPTVRLVAASHHIPPDDWTELAAVLDAGIDDLSAEQRALAVERAARRIGVAELDARDEEHLRVLWDELRAATLRRLLDRLVAKRELEVTGVGESGQLLYRRPSRTGRA